MHSPSLDGVFPTPPLNPGRAERTLRRLAERGLCRLPANAEAPDGWTIIHGEWCARQAAQAQGLPAQPPAIILDLPAGPLPATFWYLLGGLAGAVLFWFGLLVVLPVGLFVFVKTWRLLMSGGH
jgi:hypothetical protein